MTRDTCTFNCESEMGKVSLKSIGKFKRHQNTAVEYDGDVSWSAVEAKLIRIASYLSRSGHSKVCFVVGMGAHPKSTYTLLSSEPGIEVLCYRSLFPPLLTFLRPFIASYGGLIRISSSDQLMGVFDRLSTKSMAGVYIFEPAIESSFIQSVCSVNGDGMPCYGVQCDESYFSYVVDRDNFESTTGIVEIVSYGNRAPETLKM